MIDELLHVFVVRERFSLSDIVKMIISRNMGLVGNVESTEKGKVEENCHLKAVRINREPGSEGD